MTYNRSSVDCFSQYFPTTKPPLRLRVETKELRNSLYALIKPIKTLCNSLSGLILFVNVCVCVCVCVCAA
jgi:hypothetical protein